MIKDKPIIEDIINDMDRVNMMINTNTLSKIENEGQLWTIRTIINSTKEYIESHFGEYK